MFYISDASVRALAPSRCFLRRFELLLQVFQRTEKHLKGSYDSAVQALLPDVHTTIKYLAGKGVRDITDMILAGPRHDVLILSILGNDFVHWVRRAKNDWACDAVETYPHNFDEDLHALVSAVAEKSSRCAFLLFGEASKWGYNHRYDDFSERARRYVDDLTGHAGVVFFRLRRHAPNASVRRRDALSSRRKIRLDTTMGTPRA